MRSTTRTWSARTLRLNCDINVRLSNVRLQTDNYCGIPTVVSLMTLLLVPLALCLVAWFIQKDLYEVDSV